MSADRTNWLVARRHVALGRPRSMICRHRCPCPPLDDDVLGPPSAWNRKPPMTTAPQRTARPRPKRGEGQWALGYTEPLNKNEQTKKDDNPLNVRARILNIYSKRGFSSIDPADLRGRFRWMGLYTQRAPGFDGGKTAMLEEEELDDRYFMLRVRSDGKLLSPDTRRALGSIGVDYARDTADVTDRENIQYHWI